MRNIYQLVTILKGESDVDFTDLYDSPSILIPAALYCSSAIPSKYVSRFFSAATAEEQPRFQELWGNWQ